MLYVVCFYEFIMYSAWHTAPSSAVWGKYTFQIAGGASGGCSLGPEANCIVDNCQVPRSSNPWQQSGLLNSYFYLSPSSSGKHEGISSGTIKRLEFWQWYFLRQVKSCIRAWDRDWIQCWLPHCWPLSVTLLTWSWISSSEGCMSLPLPWCSSTAMRRW